MAALFLVDGNKDKERCQKSSPKVHPLNKTDEEDDFWWAGVAYNPRSTSKLQRTDTLSVGSDRDYDVLSSHHQPNNQCVKIDFGSESDSVIEAGAITLESTFSKLPIDDEGESEDEGQEIANRFRRLFSVKADMNMEKNKEYFENLRKCYDLGSDEAHNPLFNRTRCVKPSLPC